MQEDCANDENEIFTSFHQAYLDGRGEGVIFLLADRLALIAYPDNMEKINSILEGYHLHLERTDS